MTQFILTNRGAVAVSEVAKIFIEPHGTGRWYRVVIQTKGGGEHSYYLDTAAGARDFYNRLLAHIAQGDTLIDLGTLFEEVCEAERDAERTHRAVILEDAGEPLPPMVAPAEEIKAAILSLNPEDDTHWVRTGPVAGLPKLSAVEGVCSAIGLTRDHLEAVLPGWNRDKAFEKMIEEHGAKNGHVVTDIILDATVWTDGRRKWIEPGHRYRKVLDGIPYLHFDKYHGRYRFDRRTQDKTVITLLGKRHWIYTFAADTHPEQIVKKAKEMTRRSERDLLKARSQARRIKNAIKHLDPNDPAQWRSTRGVRKNRVDCHYFKRIARVPGLTAEIIDKLVPSRQGIAWKQKQKRKAA